MYQFAADEPQAWGGAATATAGATGARAFVPPAQGSSVTPYDDDFVSTRQPTHDDNYYYASTTPIGGNYSQGDGEYYDPNSGYQDPHAVYQDPHAAYQDPPHATYQDPHAAYQDSHATYQDPHQVPYQDRHVPYQAPLNNGYYGYPDGTNNQGYYNDGYDSGKAYPVNEANAGHTDYAFATENDPHHAVSKPDARE